MNSKLNLRQNILSVAIAMIITGSFGFVSCGDDEKSGGGVYDPSKPVALTSFHPEEGGMASKVIFDGENFGSDPSKIKVYFNQKLAPVVGSTGKRMYAVVPRMPGDTCTVSVVVGNDSVVYDKQFRYKISVTVSTIAGNGTIGQWDNPVKVGSLEETALFPSSMCLDGDGNLFVMVMNNNGGVVRINEEENIMVELATVDQGVVWPASPCVDMSTGIVTFPSDHVIPQFFVMDPNKGWALQSKEMKIKPHPTIPMPVQAWKKTTASCRYDGYFYTHFHNGQIVKIHPKTYETEFIYQLKNTGDCYGMAFHPLQPKMLYMAFWKEMGEYSHGLYSMDITDPEGTFKRLSATFSGGGYRDGELEVAQFNSPCQIFFDFEGNLYIADTGNHCIRKVTPENMVETVLGVPGVAGFADGGKEEALFNEPRGIAVAADGTVYVGDHRNGRVRKLAIE